MAYYSIKDIFVVTTRKNMSFKKLHPYLQEVLEQLSIDQTTSFQKKSIPIIKSGANVFCVASKDSGKTTTLILTTLQKLKCEAEGDAPRAVIIVENKSKALELYDAFLTYTKYSSIRVYASYEALHIDVQKSEIYMGIDILITTPKTIRKLFLNNGVSISQLKILSIEDADFLIQKSEYTDLLTATEGIKKCQYVIYSEKLNPKLKRLEDYFMEHARIVRA
ncbi:DEAD/DEAH box helicase [Maribacter sp. HTCC2170]|uniref:DEAD/DEAH box helicase n=1 Tax=Maribacter sp. (strain HTCC2170 / KCCM 42371) TaxID=313603 RepID=UPI00006AFD8F|nr:DEAD/DEAH box helicase [Maribacter sp. HTCC2170]EAR01378.1 ATP-dependent RNA helicase, DEAD box family protein [Maribacter sp. HTCC2170]